MSSSATYAPRVTRDRTSGDYLAECVEWDGDQIVNEILVGWFDTHALALAAANEETTDCCRREAAEMAEAEALFAAEMRRADEAMDAMDAARFASEDAAYGAYVEEHGHNPAAWPAPAPETFASDPDAWVAVSAPYEPADFRPVTTYLPDMVGAAVSQTGPDTYRALWMGYYVGEPFATYCAAECEAVAAWAKENPGTPARAA